MHETRALTDNIFYWKSLIL